MAKNPWQNWSPPKPGSTANRNAQNKRRNAPQGYRKPNYNAYSSWWRPPAAPGPTTKPNPFQAAMMRSGGNAVTGSFDDFSAPGGPGGPGGGGYSFGGGGGGGGGGGPAVTQAMIDALTQALGAHGPQLGYTPLPAFQGQALGAFNAAPYDTQRGLVTKAAAADRANFATNQAATTQAVSGAYSNPYATAQVQSGPQMSVMGAGLMGTAGAVASPDAANEANQANAQNQGSFQDLLSILSANSQSSQNSRMAQVGMDANYGRQQLEAQTLGLQGGIAANQANAQNVWQQQAAERDYQNQLMAQQYAAQNAQGQQAVNQANWTQRNTTMQARLQPILDLISQSRGIPGLNWAQLIAAIQGGAA